VVQYCDKFAIFAIQFDRMVDRFPKLIFAPQYVGMRALPDL
jgi:hypothetical protein